MLLIRTVLVSAAVLNSLAAADLMTPVFANHQAAAVIEQALGGAAPELAKGGTVLEQDGDLLQGGDIGWIRVPPPARFQETPPRCKDGVWMRWADAYLHTKDYAGATFGDCYMLASDEGASNIDPYAEGW
jgi:hypothetical protein